MSNQSTLLRLLSLIVLVSAGAFVLMLVANSWGEIRTSFAAASPALALVGWIVATASAFTAYFAFWVLFQQAFPGAFSPREVAHFYFASQLLKHLPGRGWGVAYQAAMTRNRIPIAVWANVNVAHAILSMCFAMLFAAAAIAWWYSLLAGTITLFVGLLAILHLWQPRYLNWLVACVRVLPKRLEDSLFPSLVSLISLDGRLKVRVVAALTFGWLIYFGSWACYGAAFPGLGPDGGIYFAATYSIAWLVGYLTIVTPSGLGVRELAFAVLAADFPPDVVVYGMLIGRLGLTATDLCLGLLFWPFRNQRV